MFVMEVWLYKEGRLIGLSDMEIMDFILYLTHLDAWLLMPRQPCKINMLFFFFF